MKFILFIFSFIFLASCSTKKDIPDKDICFLIYDLKKEKFEEIENEKRCQERFPAASTFKVALSVMGFDSGVLLSETWPVFKWSGVKHPLEGWNKNQTPSSWMKESVVWVSQEITPKIGMDKIIQYLHDFEYGNEDMTRGLRFAWLTPTPTRTEPQQNSLKISGFEQVSFLKKLWRGELKASSKAQELTRKIMPVEKSSNGWTLQGKTGSGYIPSIDGTLRRLGWYVAHLEKDDSEYIVVINFTDKKQATGTYGGPEAKGMAQKFLSEKRLW